MNKRMSWIVFYITVNQKSGHTPILDFSDYQCDPKKMIFIGTESSSHNESALTTTDQPRHRSSFPSSWFPKLKDDDLKLELVIGCESIPVRSESTPRPPPSVWHSEPPVSTKWGINYTRNQLNVIIFLFKTKN